MPAESHAAALAIRPTPFTLRLRRCLLWQLWRFIVINLRMTVMIIKSHDTRLMGGERRRPTVVPRSIER